MAQNYVYSTMSNDQAYVVWNAYPDKMKPSVRKATVVIAGQANIADMHFMTPKGVMTVVDDAQLKALEDCPAFKRHKERGFITVEKAKADADEVALDMTEKDGSAPLTAEDFGKEAPVEEVKPRRRSRKAAK